MSLIAEVGGGLNLLVFWLTSLPVHLLLPDCGCSMTSCLLSLLPYLPCPTISPQAVNQKALLKVPLVRYLVTAVRSQERHRAG